MNVTPRILILTLSFGSGHVRASQAIAKELKRKAPSAEVRVVDVLEDCRAWFRAVYVWPYWIMVRHLPRLWERLFERRLREVQRHTASAWLFRRGCRSAFEIIESIQPTSIVCVEVAAAEIAAIAHDDHITDASVINVITDHEAEPAWISERVQTYAVASDRVREQLVNWGAPSQSIEVTGIPVDESFNTEPKTKSDDSSTPRVLLMGGGMGPTRMDRVAARLCESEVPMQIIAVAGRDVRTRRKLLRLNVKPPVSLHVVGWTDEIAALMKTATVIVTKPGGVTISEAALCGLPAVFFDSIPGPERRNAVRVAEAEAGVITNGIEETAAATVSLLKDGCARQSMSAKARKFARPNAAIDIAHIVLNAQLSDKQIETAITA